MATLEKIRNKAGILISVFIGVALFAFVMSDLMKPGKSMFASSANEIGEIDGDPIAAQEFSAQLETLTEWTRMQYQGRSLDENTNNRLHDQAWEQLVREKLLAKEYEKLGITVTEDELLDLIIGKNAHPAIQQMFNNPDKGGFDRQMAAESYKRRKENAQAAFYWDYVVEQIKIERLYNKYTSLIKKGMFVTSSLVKNEVEGKKNNVDFEFVVKRYASVSDSSISVSPSEIKDYYNSNKEDYKQEATRDVEYVTFDVAPSAEDNKATQEMASKAKEQFANPSTDAAQFINRNSDNAPYTARNLKIDDVAVNLRVFASTAAAGEVYGPYFEGDSYKLTRLVAVKQIPDSVKARHILIPANTPNGDKVADSLFRLARIGSDFAELARNNSKDPGSAVNGGDLGWFKEGMMVPEFNDACFNNNKGDVVKVQSQYGYHIINIQDIGKTVTKYELATYEKKVTYSQKTYQDIYAQATRFASENDTKAKFEKSVQSKNLTPRYARDLKANDRMVASLESPRQMVKWAFEVEAGEVSPIFEFGDKFVVATLINQKEEGYASVNDVQNEIKAKLVKDKKAAKFIDELKGSSTMAVASSKAGNAVQTATGINFSSFQVPGAGFEPALVALATNSAQNVVSQPVKGESGVYVVNVTASHAGNSSAEAEKAQLNQQASYKVDYKAYDALKMKAEIKDQRYKFY
jgi:peptidyl-prolyl cis-trans isomerase D